MIYLIGGIPRSGKTIVAKKLAARLGIPWIPADSIEGIPKYYFSGKEYAARFPKDIMRSKTGNSNDKMYGQYTATETRSAYIRQGESVWVAVERLVDSLIAEKYNFIIEGYQLLPKQVSELQALYRDKVKSAFLIKVDPTLIREHIVDYATNDDWVTGKTSDPRVFGKIAAMLSNYGKYIEKETTKYKVKSFNMERNFSAQAKAVLNYLSS